MHTEGVQRTGSFFVADREGRLEGADGAPPGCGLGGRRREGADLHRRCEAISLLGDGAAGDGCAGQVGRFHGVELRFLGLELRLA